VRLSLGRAAVLIGLLATMFAVATPANAAYCGRSYGYVSPTAKLHAGDVISVQLTVAPTCPPPKHATVWITKGGKDVVAGPLVFGKSAVTATVRVTLRRGMTALHIALAGKPPYIYSARLLLHSWKSPVIRNVEIADQQHGFGTATAGTVETCLGNWDEFAAIRLDWLLDGAVVGHGVFRVVRPADVGHSLACSVTVTNPLGRRTATSAPIPVLAADAQPALALDGWPEALSDWHVGDVVTADAELDAWTPAAESVTYEWLLDDSPIPGEVDATYTIRPSDDRHRLALRVTAHRAGFPDFPFQDEARVVGLPFKPGGGGPVGTG